MYWVEFLGLPKWAAWELVFAVFKDTFINESQRTHIFVLIELELSVSSVTQSCPALCNPMDCGTGELGVGTRISDMMKTHWTSRQEF